MQRVLSDLHWGFDLSIIAASKINNRDIMKDCVDPAIIERKELHSVGIVR
jgi:hypothetical protein